METIKLAMQGQSHGSDIETFSIHPYGVTPPPSWLEWWDSLAWWQKLLIGAGVITAGAGSFYILGKRHKA